MKYYEITYETGRVSVAAYESKEEASAALTEHHRRAMSGEAGGPIGQPAERIAVVREYKAHPNEYNPEQTLHVDVLMEELGALAQKLADENGVVMVDQLAVEVRNLTHPMQDRDGPFGSVFRMSEQGELPAKTWGG